MKKINFLFVFGLALPVIIAFKALFHPGPVVWGDAPYFYSEGLKELVAEPPAWTARGINFGGPNTLLWISPLMFIYGILNKFLSLGNDALIRIIFYFPALALAIISPILFARRLGYPKIVQFFASLVYALNTYFLLVLDGGQIGVALAYGLFPLVLLCLGKLAAQPSFVQFFVSLTIFFLLVVSDVRFAAIAVFTVSLWLLVDHLAIRRYEARAIRFLFLLVLTTTALGAYWIVPLSGLGTEMLSVDVSKLQLLSLLNPLLLFQPHWPLNEFGKVFPPPFYFVGIPVLIFGGLLWVKEKKNWSMALLVLVFAFLVKGETPPFGGIYSWGVNLPFGSAFRDSTKFFAPLLLFAGILIGITVEGIGKLLGNSSTLLRRGVVFFLYLYLLFLVHPAIFGLSTGSGLNGVLTGRAFPQDFETIHQKFIEEKGFFRSLWFPERHPFAFFTTDKPALDAKRLVDARPFASMNTGTFDAFNFFHNKNAIDWFNLLGIRYLVFSGDTRKSSLQDEAKKDWDDLLTLVEGTKGLDKLNWGLQFPVFKVPETKPHIFSVDKLIAVVGSDDIYQKLQLGDSNFSVGNQGFLFLEDGRFDPRSLENIAQDAAILVLNEKDEADLAMSFLQEDFVSTNKANFSDWGMFKPDDYLLWKYQLLIKGIDTKEFDYGQGVALSSKEDESMRFLLKAGNDGEYVIALRSMGTPGAKLDLFFEGRQYSQTQKDPLFDWYVTSPLDLKKGDYNFVLQNRGGTQVVNTLALIPKENWEEALTLARNFTKHFKTIATGSGLQELEKIVVDGSWHPVDFQEARQSRYKVSTLDKGYWLVFTENYNPGWILKRENQSFSSYPLYSMVNGFYIDPPKGQDVEIVFQGQEQVKWGFYWSIGSLLSLALIFLYFKTGQQKFLIKR